MFYNDINKYEGSPNVTMISTEEIAMVEESKLSFEARNIIL